VPAQALYLKWRPLSFDDMIGQEHITRTLRNALRQDRIRHAYLFSGPRGTGKTTTARLLAKAVNCTNPVADQRPCNECSYCVSVNEGRFLDLIEIDAASHTSVDDVRDLRDKIGFAPTEGRYKVYIIDEVHRFSGAAFDALLKTLEEPPAHAIFVLATTEIAKVPATIKSRCLMFEFRRVSLGEVVERLALIAETEGVSIDQGALELIAREGTGSVRDSVSLLDQLLADPDEHISLEMAEQVLGTASGRNVAELVQCLIENDAARGLDLINAAVDKGADPRQFGRQVVEYLRQMMLVKMGGSNLVETTAERRAVIEQQSDVIGRKALLQAVRVFNNAIQEWQGGWQPQLPLELAFVESIKPVIEEEPVPRYMRTQDDLPAPTRKPNASSVPAEPAPPVPGSALQVSDIKAQWGKIQKVAKDLDRSLPPLLDHAAPHEVRKNRLIISARNEFFKGKLEAPDKRQLLEKVLAEVLGISLQVNVIVIGDSGKYDQDIEDIIAGDDILAYGINELGGEITDVDE